MSLLFYAPKLYPGTRELMEKLQAKRLIKHDGLCFLNKGTPLQFTRGDAIVCWGAHVPPISGVPTLNASFTYANMLQVNMIGLSKLKGLGNSVFGPFELTPAKYAAGLKALGDKWWPAKYVTYAAFPEFENIGTSYHNFKKLGKALVFEGAVINGSAPSDLLTITSKLNLDFMEVYYGVHQDTSYLLKVLTAPTLTPTTVDIVAEHIYNWAKRVTTDE